MLSRQRPRTTNWMAERLQMVHGQLQLDAFALTYRFPNPESMLMQLHPYASVRDEQKPKRYRGPGVGAAAKGAADCVGLSRTGAQDGGIASAGLVRCTPRTGARWRTGLAALRTRAPYAA